MAVSTSTRDFLQSILKSLENPIEDDPLDRCGKAALDELSADPGAALKLADEKLHVYPFKDVDICWRRLYTDAGISKAISIISSSKEDQNWLSEAVKQLDMVLIMTGAPLRQQLVDEIFKRLQHDVDDHQQDWTDEFPESSLKRPRISYPIPASQLTITQFERHIESPEPIAIKGAINHWPALTDRPWRSPAYLKYRTFGGRRLVPVELGRSYTDEDWSQTIIPFSQFLDQYVSSPDSGLAYLAQHDLFAQIPALRNDIAIPDFCYTSPSALQPASSIRKPEVQLDEPLLNAWFGPAGTISPLHTDPYHNILCQVVGKKYVRLYAPDQTAKLYPRGVENGIDMSNTSRVPLDLVEMSLGPDEEFSSFHDARYVETILNEGECLYIPVGWWHYVRSLSTSFSVSFWWN